MCESYAITKTGQTGKPGHPCDESAVHNPLPGAQNTILLKKSRLQYIQIWLFYTLEVDHIINPPH